GGGAGGRTRAVVVGGDGRQPLGERGGLGAGADLDRQLDAREQLPAAFEPTAGGERVVDLCQGRRSITGGGGEQRRTGLRVDAQLTGCRIGGGGAGRVAPQPANVAELSEALAGHPTVCRREPPAVFAQLRLHPVPVALGTAQLQPVHPGDAVVGEGAGQRRGPSIHRLGPPANPTYITEHHDQASHTA